MKQKTLPYLMARDRQLKSKKILKYGK